MIRRRVLVARHSGTSYAALALDAQIVWVSIECLVQPAADSRQPILAEVAIQNDAHPMPSVFDLPESHRLRTVHNRSIRNRAEIEASAVCGCFFCKKTFASNEIEDWTDTSNPLFEQTALCPHCGID